ncbi:MAG: hypothetical protein IKW80_10600 [Thermoguttaceae bacterium]|nr:hypothetical protein [Thermoguttaceae bacterium]
MKPSFFDIIRRILFWKSCPRRFQSPFGSVEAACVYVPTAERQAIVRISNYQ